MNPNGVSIQGDWSQIKEAKRSGSVASEIIGLVLKELKRHPHEIRQEDASLIKRIENIERQIKKVLKLDQ